MRAIIYCIASLSALAIQSQSPSFDVASLKIASTARFRGSPLKGGPGTDEPGRITYRGFTLAFLLDRAWQFVRTDRLIAPPWVTDPSRKFDIVATLPPQTSQQDFQLMLQNLLIDRFKLKLHHETRNFPGYDLVIAPGGPKLKPSDLSGRLAPGAREDLNKTDAGGFSILPPGHRRSIRIGNRGEFASYQEYTVDEFVGRGGLSKLLGDATGQPNLVVNKTGLTGKYDIRIKFDAAPAPGTVPSPSSDLTGQPTIFKALEQQLGLRLVRVKAIPVDVLVIDHAEKFPSGN